MGGKNNNFRARSGEVKMTHAFPWIFIIIILKALRNVSFPPTILRHFLQKASKQTNNIFCIHLNCPCLPSASLSHTARADWLLCPVVTASCCLPLSQSRSPFHPLLSGQTVCSFSGTQTGIDSQLCHEICFMRDVGEWIWDLLYANHVDSHRPFASTVHLFMDVINALLISTIFREGT